MTRSCLFLVSLLAACESGSKAPPRAESSAAPAAVLREGNLAPVVEFEVQSGRRIPLDSLRGKFVVLYFYPEDQTRGCTIQAQGVRDAFAEFTRAGAVVLGVSTQDAASHRAFIDAEALPFDLAVDSDGALAQAFGVELEGGRAARDTVLIDEDGVVRKIWRRVSPRDHTRLVLAEIAKW